MPIDMHTLTDIEAACPRLGHEWSPDADPDCCPACLQAALEATYRAGQEAMRERCAALCDDWEEATYCDGWHQSLQAQHGAEPGGTP